MRQRLSAGLLALLAGCGGGGGGGAGEGGGVTGPSVVFTGGSIEDLEALSPSLTFERLEITGRLELVGSATLTVGSLLLAETGSIGYAYSDCAYFAAPGLTVQATGDVTLLGGVFLDGRRGTRVLATATCKSCYGQDGGAFTVNTAGSIRVAGRLWTHGGDGGTVAYGYGCSGGAAGGLHLQGLNIDLTGAELDATGGDGGETNGITGGRGAAAPVALLAANALRMVGGDVVASGELRVEATETEIYGRIAGSPVLGTIAGAPDTAPPLVVLQRPTSGALVPFGQPVTVEGRVEDAGTGVRTIHVTGLGHDGDVDLATLTDGAFSLTIPAAASPAALTVTATDNLGFVGSAAAGALNLGVTLEVEPNQPGTSAQALVLPADVAGDAAVLDAVGTTGGYHDWYRITLGQQKTVTASLDFSGSASGNDLDLYVGNSTLSVKSAQSTSDNATVRTESCVVVLAAGTWYVVVHAYATNQRVPYRLRITTN